MPLRRLISHREPFGRKAPITEALVDVRVPQRDGLSLGQLRDFNATMADEYPKIQTQTEWANQVVLQPQANTSTVTSTHRVRGFVFHSEDGREVVQVRRDGFTFSLLPPYTDWRELRAKAQTAWSRYVEVSKPEQVTRVGLRYLNRLSLPAGPLELRDWFTLQPEVCSELGQLTDLLIRVAIRHPDDESFVVLATLGTAPPQKPDESAFLFDIDTWNAVERPVDETIWDVLDDLHEYKNDVFFGSLTPATYKELRDE